MSGNGARCFPDEEEFVQVGIRSHGGRADRSGGVGQGNGTSPQGLARGGEVLVNRSIIAFIRGATPKGG